MTMGKFFAGAFAVETGSIREYRYARAGNKLILNTRTSVALDRPGIPKSEWYGRNQTGVRLPYEPTQTFNDLANEQLRRNGQPLYRPSAHTERRERSMKSGRPVVILDSYGWLPGYGETGLQARSEGLDWIVEIVYDDSVGTNTLKRHLRFLNCCCFFQASFPGPAPLAIEFDRSEDPSSLLEYPDSEAAIAWTRHFRSRWIVKHYSICFLSANQQIQAFADDVTLSEPTVVASM
jgi:hypothetical protein